MIDRDIWITVNELIKLYGNDAAIHAAMRADALADQDDADGYLVWRRVTAAIRELEDTDPGGLVN
jgi:hypothetical protein